MRTYFPAHNGIWENRPPNELGFDAEKFADAINYVKNLKSTLGRNISELIERQFSDPPPWNATLGPVRDRSSRNGLVLKNGYIVSEWGDTAQVDMASSVTKIFLNACVGLMREEGKLTDLDVPVAATTPGPWFTSAQN